MAGEAVEPEVTALAVTEARRLFEGEACALSAACITDEQLAQLDRLVADMQSASGFEETERLEQEFHVTVARASGNAPLHRALRICGPCAGSPQCAPRPRCASGAPARISSTSIARSSPPCVSTIRKPRGRRSMCISRVIDDLLTVAESDALE